MAKKSKTKPAPRTKIQLRPSTWEKYRSLKEHTGIPFPELADKAIDALLEKKGIPFPGHTEAELMASANA